MLDRVGLTMRQTRPSVVFTMVKLPTKAENKVEMSKKGFMSKKMNQQRLLNMLGLSNEGSFLEELISHLMLELGSTKQKL